MDNILIKSIVSSILWLTRKLSTKKFRKKIVNYVKKNKSKSFVIALIIISIGCASFYFYPNETKAVIESVSRQVKHMQLMEE